MSSLATLYILGCVWTDLLCKLASNIPRPTRYGPVARPAALVTALCRPDLPLPLPRSAADPRLIATFERPYREVSLPVHAGCTSYHAGPLL